MPLAPPLLRLGFDHGVKASLDPTAVPPNALWRARNVRLYQGGLARVRPGSFALTQSRGPGSPQGLIAAFGGLLMVHNTNLVLYDLATGSGTELGTGITSDPTTPVEMIRWTRGGAEIVYLFTGEGIWETDGTEGGTKLREPYEPQQGEASNLLLDSDTGKQDVNSDPAKSRVALLRVSDGQRIVAAHGNVVSMCEPLDATYWPADQQFWLPEDGGRIMALEQRYGAVILFRDRDIWAYFKAYEGDEGGKGPTIQIKSIGCAAGRTVVPIPGLGLAFVGGPQGTVDNVYLLTYVQAIEGQVRAEPIGGDIRDILVEAVRRYGLEGACATYYDGEYRLSIPANAEEDRVFLLDIRNQRGWFIDSGPRTVQYAIEGGNLYSAAWGEGRIDRITPEALRDGDKPIPFNIRWRRESLLGPSRVKRVFVVTKSPATIRPTE